MAILIFQVNKQTKVILPISIHKWSNEYTINVSNLWAIKLDFIIVRHFVDRKIFINYIFVYISL